MRTLLLAFIVHASALSFCLAQEKDTILQVPSQWRYEKLEFPLSFAPGLPLIGFEEVYFAPGWNNSESEEFWTYAFVWVLEEPLQIEKEEMKQYLQDYYNGLMKVVGDFNKIETTISLKNTSSGYKGKAETLDGFFTKDPINLNITIEKLFEGKFWVFRLSPKEMEHPVWKELHTIKLNH